MCIKPFTRFVRRLAHPSKHGSPCPWSSCILKAALRGPQAARLPATPALPQLRRLVSSPASSMSWAGMLDSQRESPGGQRLHQAHRAQPPRLLSTKGLQEAPTDCRRTWRPWPSGRRCAGWGLSPDWRLKWLAGKNANVLRSCASARVFSLQNLEPGCEGRTDLMCLLGGRSGLRLAGSPPTVAAAQAPLQLEQPRSRHRLYSCPPTCACMPMRFFRQPGLACLLRQSAGLLP